MASDVVDLRDFYRSALGQVARRMIRRAIQRVWPDLHGMRLLGIGYPAPFLSAVSEETERTIAVMPATLGVLRWPAEGRPAQHSQGRRHHRDRPFSLLRHRREERRRVADAEEPHPVQIGPDPLNGAADH